MDTGRLNNHPPEVDVAIEAFDHAVVARADEAAFNTVSGGNQGEWLIPGGRAGRSCPSGRP